MRKWKSLSVTLVLLVASICLVGGCILPGTATGYQQPQEVVEISGDEVMAALKQVAPNLEIGGDQETRGRGIVVSYGMYNAWPLEQILAEVQKLVYCLPSDIYFGRDVVMIVADLYEMDTHIAVGIAATYSDVLPPWFIIAFAYDECRNLQVYAIDLAGNVWDPRDCLIYEINFY